MKKRHVVIPVFVPHKGCPFDCIYCNQKNISGQQEEMDLSEMKDIIEKYLSSVDTNTHVEIGFYGGSFTGIDLNQQISFLKLAHEYIRAGKVDGIRLSTRPDYIDEKILDYLWEYGVKTIELGVQSLDDQVLVKSCRGHTSEDVYRSSKLIKNRGFSLGIQTMIGLPGDTRQKDMETALKVVELLPDVVRIYPTLVIKDTYLEKMYLSGKYKPLELDEAVDICADLLEIYYSNGINVIRVGLQPTENINENSDVVAGPFHPAFRQLVESRLMLKKIVGMLNGMDIKKGTELEIYTGSSNVSNVAGQKRKNIEYLIQKYGFSEIRIRSNKDMGNEIEIRLN